MTLGFSTKWPERMGELAGQSNCFQDKIWNGLIREDIVTDEDVLPRYENDYKSRFGKYWDWQHEDVLAIKVHTMREDSSNQWKPGMDIHMVINKRTKNQFQFAPTLKCVSVQEIKIDSYESDINSTFTFSSSLENYRYRVFRVWVDGKMLPLKKIKQLATNDGFDSVQDFFAYFNTDFTGKVIHWTDLKY